VLCGRAEQTRTQSRLPDAPGSARRKKPEDTDRIPKRSELKIAFGLTLNFRLTSESSLDELYSTNQIYLLLSINKEKFDDIMIVFDALCELIKQRIIFDKTLSHN